MITMRTQRGLAALVVGKKRWRCAPSLQLEIFPRNVGPNTGFLFEGIEKRTVRASCEENSSNDEECD